MKLPVILRPAAEEDIGVASRFLEARRVGSGIKFLTRLEQMLDRIERMPEVYGIVWRGVRAARLKPFSYVLYYRVLTNRVDVIAVVHGSQSAAVWKKRLN